MGERVKTTKLIEELRSYECALVEGGYATLVGQGMVSAHRVFLQSGGCEDRDILWAFFTNLSIETIYLSLELREKWPYLQNYH